MSTFINKSRKRSTQAIRWLEKHEHGQSTKGFPRWVTRSDEHTEEFIAVAAETELLASSSVLSEFDTELAVEQARAYQRRSRFIRNAGVSAIAAGLVAVVILTVMLFQRTQEAHRLVSISTLQQPARQVVLDDGSRLDLSPNTVVVAQMSDTERRVDLQAGEALFKVVRDRTRRPFLVDIPLARIEVRGTSFRVQRAGRETHIHVVEDVVKVVATQFRQDPIIANPGDDVTVLASGEVVVATVAAKEPQTSDKAGTTGTIRSRTLGEIAAAFNKANQKPEFVVEGAARDKTLGVSVKENEPEKLIEILEREPSLKVSREGDRVVIHMRNGE